MMRNTMRAAMTAACLIGMTTLASLAASAFEGVWKVKDTAGRPFEITLSSGGVARATRGEGMTGTWKEEENAAVITWTTGWTTKITKEGNLCEGKYDHLPEAAFYMVGTIEDAIEKGKRLAVAA